MVNWYGLRLTAEYAKGRRRGHRVGSIVDMNNGLQTDNPFLRRHPRAGGDLKAHASSDPCEIANLLPKKPSLKLIFTQYPENDNCALYILKQVQEDDRGCECSAS